jgi:hypothetical protein
MFEKSKEKSTHKYKTFNLHDVEEQFANHIRITGFSHLQTRSESVEGK